MLTITVNDVLASTSYVTEVLNDLKPIILMLMGLWVAFYVIPSIIKIFRNLDELDREYLDPSDDWEYDMKFFTWGRKIDEQVEVYKSRGYSDETIRVYLEKCADFREQHLDPDNLTMIEEEYTGKIQKHFDDYGVVDRMNNN